MVWLVALAVLLDAASTMVGLRLGLTEHGVVPGRLMPVLGVAYFAVEYAVVYGLSRLLEHRGLSRRWAETIAVLGPWTAAWHNTGLILRVLRNA